jgi:hypothetical protein
LDSAMLVVADSRSALGVKPPFPLGTSTHFTEDALSAAVPDAPFAWRVWLPCVEANVTESLGPAKEEVADKRATVRRANIVFIVCAFLGSKLVHRAFKGPNTPAVQNP